MANISIYHNPRCSKSRQTLTLLEDNGVTPEVILYLKTPPSYDELAELIGKLGISARDLLRTKEAEYKVHNLANQDLADEAIIHAMVESPKLIERPIVVKGSKAVIGRPPENVLNLI